MPLTRDGYAANNGTVPLKTYKICASKKRYLFPLEVLSHRHVFFEKGLGPWSGFWGSCLEERLSFSRLRLCVCPVRLHLLLTPLHPPAPRGRPSRAGQQGAGAGSGPRRPGLVRPVRIFQRGPSRRTVRPRAPRRALWPLGKLFVFPCTDYKNKPPAWAPYHPGCCL